MNAGLTQLSTQPSKKRTAISDPKLRHAAVHMSNMPHMITLMEMNFPSGKICIDRATSGWQSR
jgi:hypothetical protein